MFVDKLFLTAASVGVIVCAGMFAPKQAVADCADRLYDSVTAWSGDAQDAEFIQCELRATDERESVVLECTEKGGALITRKFDMKEQHEAPAPQGGEQ